MKAGLSALGFQHEQINCYGTGTLNDEQQAQAIQDLDWLGGGSSSSEQTLVFLCFKGCGKIDPTNGHILTSKSFAVEQFLYELAKVQGVYAIGLFDCCRVVM